MAGPLGNMTLEDFDGKRLRKSVMRKTVDYNSAIIKELEVGIKAPILLKYICCFIYCIHFLTMNFVLTE